MHKSMTLRSSTYVDLELTWRIVLRSLNQSREKVETIIFMTTIL